MSRYSDKVLACRDCGNDFVFSSGEQEFYATRGFSEPTRCPDCRKARKAARAGGGDYTSSSSTGALHSSYSSRDSVPARTSTGTRQMFKVTCADCGQETEVPFEPRTGRPVYCRDCYEQRNGRR